MIVRNNDIAKVENLNRPVGHFCRNDSIHQSNETNSFLKSRRYVWILSTVVYLSQLQNKSSQLCNSLCNCSFLRARHSLCMPGVAERRPRTADWQSSRVEDTAYTSSSSSSDNIGLTGVCPKSALVSNSVNTAGQTFVDILVYSTTPRKTLKSHEN